MREGGDLSEVFMLLDFEVLLKLADLGCEFLNQPLSLASQPL
jgi:hypothetical protein